MRFTIFAGKTMLTIQMIIGDVLSNIRIVMSKIREKSMSLSIVLMAIDGMGEVRIEEKPR